MDSINENEVAVNHTGDAVASFNPLMRFKSTGNGLSDWTHLLKRGKPAEPKSLRQILRRELSNDKKADKR